MLTKFLLCFGRKVDCPYILHLLSFVYLLHQGIIECVFSFFLWCNLLSGPKNSLGAIGKTPAGKIRGRIRLYPGDVVYKRKALELESDSDAIDVMKRSTYPYGSIIL
jgi:hypothetical protein